jgi:hypothetical protein
MPIPVDIARLLSSKAGEHLQESFTHSEEGITPNPRRETEESIQAVILFQAAMEAVITEEIENDSLLVNIKKENEALFAKHKSLSFKNKWEKAFDELKITKRPHLEAYLSFYSTHRIPISHPKSRYISLEDYSYHTIEAGINHGKKAMELLMKALKKKL